MTKSYDQTFMLTTSLVSLGKTTTTACTAQSGLTPVRSVECGLFA